MMALEPRVAKQIIERVGGPGQPPEYGFQFFTAGLDQYLRVLDGEYLATYLKDGGSAFKLVVGAYGGGKTHFLYCLRELAWKHNFVVSYVSLKPDESPFHQLHLVYKAAAKAMAPPLTPDELLSGCEVGIVSFLRRWYASERQKLHAAGGQGDEVDSPLAALDQLLPMASLTFTRAVKAAFTALVRHRDDDFDDICQWLVAEGFDRTRHKRHGILQAIDRVTAFSTLRSLAQWVRQIGYSGLVVLLDEAERVPGLSTHNRELHLNNLRALIDECGQTAFQGVLFLYAVPDVNFLEGRTQIYEALSQRLTTVFEALNPTGVRIELEKVIPEPVRFLGEVGKKLTEIYEVAYNCKLDQVAGQGAISETAEAAYSQRFADIGYKRLFVQDLVKRLHILRQTTTGSGGQ